MSSQPYPIDLVLVRHGQSEGNLAQARSKIGDDSLWTEEFKNRHTSRYRLTSAGVEQAKQAGEWIKENISSTFDRYYCSEYTRAMETAAHLGFENAEWFSEFYLREQDMGVLQNSSKTERNTQYKAEMERRSKDVFYYAPPGGESIANCALRTEQWLNQLRQACSGFKVIAVCHGNILKAIRIRLEKMKQEEWVKLTNDPAYLTYNCQIIQYTRRDPHTGKIARHFSHVRSICPWDPSKGSTEWTKIHRATFSNEELLRIVEDNNPRLIDNEGNEEVLISE